VELNQDLTAQVPGTDRVLIEPTQGMGEGSHVYRIKGKYYIVSAIPGAHVPMKCARADKLADQENNLDTCEFGQLCPPPDSFHTCFTFFFVSSSSIPLTPL
jgi:hypothetical protein